MSLTGEQWVAMYTSIDRHAEWCAAAGFSRDTTIRDRTELLTRVSRDLDDLHTATTQQYAAWLARPGWSYQTRATYFAHLNGYLAWAAAEGIITANPLAGLAHPKVPHQRPRSIEAEAAQRVLAEAVEPWRTAAILARYAGLRCCEIARACREDITGPAPQGHIRVAGKGGRVDEIPTSPEIWSHVRTRPAGLLLVTQKRGLQYNPRLLSSLFADYCRRRLGADLALHDLRRYFGNSLRRARDSGGNAIDMEVIRQLMRHSSLATTQRYLTPDDEERQQAILALSAA